MANVTTFEGENIVSENTLKIYFDVLSSLIPMYISGASGQRRPDCSTENPGRRRKSVGFKPHHRRAEEKSM